MEEQLSEVLDNLLGLLLLEGSYDIEETEDALMVSIQTTDAGRLIGYRGESLEALQLIANQIMTQKTEQGSSSSKAFKRVIVDVEGWRKQKEEDLQTRAGEWAKQVKETGEPMDLEPMSSWQRRVIHMVVQETDGVYSESEGEGRDRHIVIKPGKAPKSEETTKE